METHEGGLNWVSRMKNFATQNDNEKTKNKNNKHNYFYPGSLLTKLPPVHPPR